MKIKKCEPGVAEGARFDHWQFEGHPIDPGARHASNFYSRRLAFLSAMEQERIYGTRLPRRPSAGKR